MGGGDGGGWEGGAEGGGGWRRVAGEVWKSGGVEERLNLVRYSQTCTGVSTIVFNSTVSNRYRLVLD